MLAVAETGAGLKVRLLAMSNKLSPMKPSLGSLVNRVNRRSAFTLIELLTVMAIILVLAGLIINIAGSANYNTAKSRARGEIKAMEVALESYKADNGSFPAEPNAPPTGSAPTTTMLDPHAVNDTSNTDPNNSSSNKYKQNSEYLYQVLSGFPVNVSGTSAASTPNPSGTAATMSKAYMKFAPGQLQTAKSFEGNAPTTVSINSPYMYLIDPFGFSYGYSTINATSVAYNNTRSPPVTTPVTEGYNPTFDLWSTAGYASGGKSLPSQTPTGGPAAVYSSLWITNW